MQEKLVAIVNGMLWQHKYNFIDVYREEAFLAGKAIVRQVSRRIFSSFVEHSSERADLSFNYRIETKLSFLYSSVFIM